MSRFAHPLVQEAAQIYFVEGRAWVAYGYFLALLAAVQLLTLLLPSLDPSSWMGSAQIFKVSCVVSLFSGVYFTLKLANQEYTPWRFAPLKRWLEEEGFSPYGLALAQLSILGAYSIIFVLLYLGLAALLGSVIGQNRAEAIQLNVDIARADSAL